MSHLQFESVFNLENFSPNIRLKKLVSTLISLSIQAATQLNSLQSELLLNYLTLYPLLYLFESELLLSLSLYTVRATTQLLTQATTQSYIHPLFTNQSELLLNWIACAELLLAKYPFSFITYLLPSRRTLLICFTTLFTLIFVLHLLVTSLSFILCVYLVNIVLLPSLTLSLF